MTITELQRTVLQRFEAEVHEAGPAQFDHLAYRPEGPFPPELADAMRAVVERERAMRAVQP
jgi:hypothetical protein